MKYCPACARSLDDTRTRCPFDDIELLDADPMVGRVAGTKYAIISRLGRGGMGVVYKARHIFMDRFVALKVIHPKLTRDRRYVNMLRQEALVAAKFTHPNAVALHDFGFMEDEATFYMVMEYLRGMNLRRTIRHLGRLLPKRALKIIRQATMAVAAAHREGIVHLDIKPENIMLVRRPEGTDLVKVLDFGIARFVDKPVENVKRRRMSLEARAKKVLVAFRKKKRQLARCKNGDDEKLVVYFTISKIGRVTKSSVKGTANKRKASCVKEILSRAVFPTGPEKQDYKQTITL